MESSLPTRPTSDLRFRLKGRNRPPAAIPTQHHVWPGPGLRYHNRSSSLSSISHSLSQLMPKNRKERGGTLRQTDDNGEQAIDTLPAVVGLIKTPTGGRQRDEIDHDMEAIRRTRSESPKKMSRVPNEGNQSPHSTSKLRTPGGWKRLWELHNTAGRDGGATDLSLNSESLNVDAQDVEQQAQSPMEIGSVAMKKSFPQIASYTPISPASLDRTPTASLQMYEEKRARREQRRSFRGSDDYLGIQGANPRTGFPDPSTATSSSTGGVISEPTQQRLDEDGRMMESARREYQAALERREMEMRRLELERERKRKDKRERAEKKRMELRARMSREGHWRSEGNQWKMVTEPFLSPIIQSTIGSPAHENPADQTPSTPSGVERNLTPETASHMKKDYFSPSSLPASVPRRFHKPNLGSAQKSSPLTRHRIPELDSTPRTPISSKYHSPYAASTSSNHHKSPLPVIAGRPASIHQKPGLESNRHGPLPIHLKDVGSRTRPRRASSAETIIHMTNKSVTDIIEPSSKLRGTSPSPQPFTTPKLQTTSPGETTHELSGEPLDLSTKSFLGRSPQAEPPQVLPANEAIATLFQSPSMNRVQTPPLLPQSPEDIFQARRITSQAESPTVVLKDLLEVKTPSSQTMEEPPSLELVEISPAEPLQVNLHSQASTTTTSTITTTGPHPLLPPNSQADYGSYTEDIQASIQPLLPSCRVAPPVIHQLKEDFSGMQNKTFPTSTVGTATSLEAPLSAPSTPTKRQIPRLCQPASFKVGKDVPKSILTSTSMCPQRPNLPQRDVIAPRTARVAFSIASPQKLGDAVRARSISLVSPKLRVQTTREGRDSDRKIFSGGDEGTGSPFQSRDELEKNSELFRKRIMQSRKAGVPSRDGREEGFVVWSTEMEGRLGNKPLALAKEKALPPIAGKKPADEDKDEHNASLLDKARGIAKEMIQTAWWFISPVFNPQSGLRWRWVRNELTWQDIFLIGAAAIFGGGAFLIVVLCARILGVGLQIVRIFVMIGRALVGL